MLAFLHRFGRSLHPAPDRLASESPTEPWLGRSFGARFKGPFLALSLLAGLTGTVLPQPSPKPSLDFWITDGAVNTILATNDTLYLGGDFSYVGPQTGPAAVFDAGTGGYLGAFPRVNGTIYAVEPDGAGGWFLGGDFTQAGNIPVNYAVHLSSDLAIDYRFNPKITGTAVYTLLFQGNVLYVGGQFSKVQGVNAAGVVAVNAIDGTLTGWNPQVNGRVNALAIRGSAIYVAGNFTSVGTTGRNRLAAIDLSTGKATDWNPNVDNVVNALKIADDVAYIGGQFGSAGGKPRNRLAAIGLTNGLASTWNPNPNGTVRTLDISGDTLFVGGDFSALGIQNRNRFAALSLSSGAVLPLDLQIEGTGSQVWSVQALDSRVFVGGYFTRAQGRNHPLVISADAETGAVTTGAPLGITYNGTADNAYIAALHISGNRLVCAGSFQSLGGVIRENAAAIDANSGRVLPWTFVPSAPVLALVYSPGRLYVAGGFTNINGAPVTGLAAVDSTSGNLLSDFAFRATNKTVPAVIKSLLLSDTRLYVGGEFSNIRDIPVRMLGVVDPATGAASTFDAKIVGGSSGVIALARAGGNLYIAGDFTSVGGQARSRLAAVSEAKATVDPWNPVPNRDVNELTALGDRLYVGGSFTTINGVGLHGVAAFTVPAHTLVQFDPALPAAATGINAISPTEHSVYFAGGFDSIGGEFRRSVACLSPATALAYDWDPAPSVTPKALAVSDTLVCIGGTFRTVGKSPNVLPIPYVAVYPRNPVILTNQVNASTLVLTANTGDRTQCVLQSASSLPNWTPVQTNASPGQVWTVPQTIGTDSHQFFRFTAE